MCNLTHRVIASSLGLFLTSIASAEAADSSVFQQSQSTKVLAQAIGASTMSGALSGTNQLVSNATLTVLGNSLSALQSSVNPPMTIGGTTYNEVYSFGFRVFDQSASFQDNRIRVYGGTCSDRDPRAAGHLSCGAIDSSDCGGGALRCECSSAYDPNGFCFGSEPFGFRREPDCKRERRGLR